MVYLFPLHQPFITPLLHHSTTPLLHHSKLSALCPMLYNSDFLIPTSEFIFTPPLHALCPMHCNSDFLIFSRGIVLPYRTTTGPTSAFRLPNSFSLHHPNTPVLQHSNTPILQHSRLNPRFSHKDTPMQQMLHNGATCAAIFSEIHKA
jgi:hypothetical protein